MEDYTPIFWVLFTVAAMVFSSVSKARKQAAKAAKEAPGQTGHPFDEAWPRMEETAPEAGRSGTDMKPGSAAGTRPVPRTGATSGTTTYTRATSGTTVWTGSAYAPVSADASTGAPYTAESYTTEGYTEEAQSLEEIPADVFRAEIASTAFEQMQPRNRSDMRTPAGKAAVNDTKSLRGTDDTQTVATDELLEEFDLRKAVIYSEILKPKFEE